MAKFELEKHDPPNFNFYLATCNIVRLFTINVCKFVTIYYLICNQNYVRTHVKYILYPLSLVSSITADPVIFITH